MSYPLLLDLCQCDTYVHSAARSSFGLEKESETK